MTDSPRDGSAVDINDFDDFEDGQDDCWNCGGEGFVSSCVEEFACIDPEGGCDYCTRRCDVCNPRRPANHTKESA